MSLPVLCTEPPGLRLMPVPVTEPNPLAEVALEPPAPAVPPTQGTLALALDPAEPGARRSLRMVPESATAPRPAARESLPDPRAWAVQFVHAAGEAVIGLRPMTQLARWATDDVLAILSRRHSLTVRQRRTGAAPLRRGVVRSVHVCTLGAGVCEVSAVISDGTRVRALAMRLEALGDRWRVTAFQLG